MILKTRQIMNVNQMKYKLKNQITQSRSKKTKKMKIIGSFGYTVLFTLRAPVALYPSDRSSSRPFLWPPVVRVLFRVEAAKVPNYVPRMENTWETITAETHRAVADANHQVIINDGIILLQHIESEEVMYVPLDAQIANMFDITLIEDEDNNGEKNMENSDDEAEVIRLWSSANTFFLINKVEACQPQFETQLKKKV